MRLKRVSVDEERLYVSNYRKEIEVVLRDIVEIHENRWLNIHPVTIRFSRATDFGTSIVFMPKRRWFSVMSSHPVVTELEQARQRALGMSQ